MERSLEMPSLEHRDGGTATNTATHADVPRRSVRQSERAFVKLSIWIVGYHRLLRWSKSAKSLTARARAKLDRQSQTVLRERAGAIEALSRQTASNSSQHKTASSSLRPISDMKIALLIPSFQMAKGGAEKVAGRLANTLAREGAEVHIFCRPPAARGPAYAVDPQIRIRHGIESDDDHVRPLIEDRFDLLIGFGMPGFYARIAGIARLLGVPFVIQECNNPDYLEHALNGTHLCRTSREAYWLRQAVMAHAAGVRLTVPDYAQSVEPDISPFVHAFYNSLARVRDANKTPAKKIICVGAMKNETKNGPAAVRAFCKFAGKHPGWSLHLYGDNQYQGELKKLEKQYPNAAIVDHGIENDVGAIYEDAYALLIPSFDEGLPNVVVEALSYGVPCIGFRDCNGVKHLILDQETGLLVDRSDPHALEHALERLTDDRFRSELSEHAIRFARANLDVSNWEARWLDLVQKAASERNAAGRPSRPPAKDTANPNAERWQTLLDRYLYFSS
ncbi:MAG: glycosyltransferase [Pseudomonadota bacterium]